MRNPARISAARSSPHPPAACTRSPPGRADGAARTGRASPIRPSPRRRSRKAAIIFGVADHHQRTIGAGFGRFQHMSHQRPAVPRRAEHRGAPRPGRPSRAASHRPSAPRCATGQHWIVPINSAIFDRREAERGHRIHAFADAIGGSSKAIRFRKRRRGDPRSPAARYRTMEVTRPTRTLSLMRRRFRDRGRRLQTPTDRNFL